MSTWIGDPLPGIMDELKDAQARIATLERQREMLREALREALSEIMGQRIEYGLGTQAHRLSVAHDIALDALAATEDA